jgi:hypothetical protein
MKSNSTRIKFSSYLIENLIRIAKDRESKG